MDEDGIVEVLKSQRLGHRLPGIRGVYAHVTPPMHTPLLEALQRRWDENGGFWQRPPPPRNHRTSPEALPWEQKCAHTTKGINHENP
jgi:hypothetical protein